MPRFIFKVLREDGSAISDQLTANNVDECRRNLESKGYLVISIEKKTITLGSGNAKDFLLFNQEFSTLIKAGLPILQSLEILLKRTKKPAFKNILENIVHDIKGGSSLSDAMAKHPVFFSTLYTATVRAGESSGALVDVLKRFIEYQKKMLAIRRKLITALAYPIFLVTALVAVLLLFFLYIIPNFTLMYNDQSATLPFLTTILITFTNGLVQYFPLVLIGTIAAGISIFFCQKTEKGRTFLDNLFLKIPLVKSLVIQYVLAQITRTLATVLRGGIPLVQAIDTTAGVISNKIISQRLSRTRELVTEGVSLANAFEQTHLAPDMTVRMIEVGESSGDLPQMLEDVAEFYDQEVENRLTVLTTMIEPVLMVSMGMIIAIIVVALYLPIFEMGSRLR